MSKHSSGPWSIDGSDIRDANGELISCAYAMNMPDGTLKRTETTFANASLIAAAPELLEALRSSLVYIAQEGTDEEYAIANAAIDKATGDAP